MLVVGPESFEANAVPACSRGSAPSPRTGSCRHLDSQLLHGETARQELRSSLARKEEEIYRLRQMADGLPEPEAIAPRVWSLLYEMQDV